MSNLENANKIFRNGKLEKALDEYEKIISIHKELDECISFNVGLARFKLLKAKKDCSKFYQLLDTSVNLKPVRLFHDFDYALESKVLNVFKEELKENKILSNVLVTVVMPTYNRIKTIKKAIDSVLAQSHANFELIIVDDGSSDGTSNFIDNTYNDKRIKLIKGLRKGVSGARNLAIKNSTGKYIFYLDSDNFWHPEYMELMIAGFLLSGKETGYSAVKVLDENSQVMGYRGESFNWDECLRSNFVDLNPFGHSRKLITELGGFDENLNRMVDWDMILRFTKKYPPFYLPCIGTYYTESSVDKNRISVKEPYVYKKVVQVKNKYQSNFKEKLKLKFSIKIPAPYEKRMQWGDFHYAESLKESLERQGHEVILDFFGKWYERPVNSEDVVIVIRGLTEYKPRSGNINIMWNISHPDQVSYHEYNEYDIVYVASNSYASFLNLFLPVKVLPLLQCTDYNRFFYNDEDVIHSEKLLFIGNSRNEFRTVVKNATVNRLDVDIYGGGWKDFVAKEMIKGEVIPNKDLRKYYGGYQCVLNDHWESMKKYGFISNRIFDVVASGGQIISDNVPSIKDVFDDYVIVEDDPALKKPNKLANNHERMEASRYVSKYHTFDSRAKKIVNDVFGFLNILPPYELTNIVPSLNGKMKNKKKIGLFLQNGSKKPTSSAYIRLFSVLTAEILVDDYEIILLDDLNESKIKNCDAIIVQRVCISDINSAKMLTGILKKYKIPFFIDTDDAFSILPDSHPEKDYYSKLDGVLRYLMDRAEKVIFSTKNLSKNYNLPKDKFVIVPNCLDERLWINYREKKENKTVSSCGKINILYMGTATHDADFEFLMPVFDKLYKLDYDFSVTIIGALRKKIDKPWLTYKVVDKNSHKYPFFAKWLVRNNDYDLGIAPLVDNDFNHSKSDIKVLDYAAIGVPAICSKVGAYEYVISKEVCFGVNNASYEWESVLRKIFETPSLIDEKYKLAEGYLWKERNVEKASVMWRDILRKI